MNAARRTGGPDPRSGTLIVLFVLVFGYALSRLMLLWGY